MLPPLQWGATLTWSAELPLPLPLQFDEVAAGCRLGFVTVRDGAVCLVSRCALHPTPRVEILRMHTQMC